MRFKGRSVIAFVLLGMFVSSILTLTAVRSNLFPGVSKSLGVAAPAASSSLSSQDVNKIAKTYELIENKYLSDVDHDKIMNGAINGMLEALEDPYTVYMDKEEAKQFTENINSSFQGIGAEVTAEDGRIKVVSPIKGSPAEKAGIMANDIVVSVNGEKLDGLTVNQAVLKIRGEKGTQAKLEILRPGSSDPTQVTIVRAEIDIETVFAEMLEDGIGKIEVRQFSANTGDHFKKELEKLESQGMKGLIIDVRNDPGGLLNVVIDMVEPFVPKGKPIVQIENRDGKKEATTSKGGTKNYPVVVLTNKGSASASEILAGAFKEAVGSKTIGETTFGKGTVQETYVKEMGDGSNIKMTVYKWLTPDGNWIHKKGIEPDIKVEQPAFFKASILSKKDTLKPDSNNEDVKNLQLMLTGIGHAPDRTDGYYSAKTAQAVKAFQTSKGLPATGEVDIATAKKLETAVLEAIKLPKNDNQLKAAVKELQTQLSK
ncbi:S41 family peptidase [Paenibacillus sp. FJAT-26967]|uniref:S41 family peptidase n=1 Tax=Paenibacillus sp. FJAT-26967 TaxID=1729690 RepID=UPI000838AB55|nr:S41 family peptidase [Paenibacillus sp. FJAT-26967]